MGDRVETASESSPARKPVCDFIGILLTDSLLNVSASTSNHPLVLLMEVTVANSIYLKQSNTRQYFGCVTCTP